MFIHFDRIHERDGHTDEHRHIHTDTAWRHRPRLCIASRGKNPKNYRVDNLYKISILQCPSSCWQMHTRCSLGLVKPFAMCVVSVAPVSNSFPVLITDRKWRKRYTVSIRIWRHLMQRPQQRLPRFYTRRAHWSAGLRHIERRTLVMDTCSNCIAELAVSFLQRMTRSAGLRLIGFQAALRFHRHSILFSVLRG